MKKIFTLLLIVYWGGGLFAQNKYQPKYLRADDKNFKNITVRADDDGWIEFKREAKLNPNNFFKDYAVSLGLDQEYNFKPLKDETDKKQQRHQHFQLYYKNIAVEGVIFSLHSEVDILTIGHGKIPDGLDQDVSKPMPEPKALELALANMKVTLDDLKKLERKKPAGTLILARISDDVVKASFKLCWVFDVYGNETFNAFTVYVDAATGEIVKKVSLIHACSLDKHNLSISSTVHQPTKQPEPNNVLFQSIFTPNYPRYLRGQTSLSFEVENDPNNTGNERLTAFNNALATRMYRGTNTLRLSNYDNSWQDYGDVRNFGLNWTNISNIDSRNAQTVHWLVQRMQQFMNQSPTNAPIGRNGINGQGLYPLVLANFPGRAAGFVKGTRHIYFGRTNDNTINSWVTIDMVGHEYMHAVTASAVVGGLTYEGQSGALNESISDIFGTALERHVLPTNAPNSPQWNWTINEDAENLRNMSNPLISGDVPQPDRYLGPNWYTGSEDNGGVHTNSGVMNRWFNMLCTGFVNPNTNIVVTAIDFDRALAIVYRALTTYTQQSSNYGDMRNGTIYAARDLYGNCSMEMRQVQNAWGSVNNNAWSYCPADCNYSVTATSSNTNPAPSSSITLTANCSGSGCYSINYIWRLNGNSVGNGQSITVNAPSSVGTYTYTLEPFKTDCNFGLQNVTVNVGNTSSTCANVGSISYDRWNNIGGGNSVQDLRNNTNNLQNAPTVSQNLSVFQAPSNICDNCGTRIRGYVCPPTSGNYTFWVEGDDNTELWLSTTDQPANVQRIAHHNDWTGALEWSKYGTQQSAVKC